MTSSAAATVFVRALAPAARGWSRRSLRTALSRIGALALLLAHLLATHAADRVRMLAVAHRHGPEAVARVLALQAALVRVQPQPEGARLQVVNRFFNERIVFAEDIDMTGRIDQWASPLELLARGAGDCEDYAIAKYFALIAVGVPPVKLRMVYVRAELASGARPHMVLAYYAEPAAEPLILDNLDTEIRPASARPDLQPVFSFNAEGLWQGVGSRVAGDPVKGLSHWREVLSKAHDEGFV